MGRGISAFLAENLEESKANPYLDFQGWRHMVPWCELAVSKSYMATARRVLSKETKLQTGVSHAPVRHANKDPSDCYKKGPSASQPVQSSKTQKGDEHEMDLSSLSVFQNTKNKTCPSLSLASEKWGERKRFLIHCGGETYSLLQWTESDGWLDWQESERKYQYLKNQQFSGMKCFIVHFMHAKGGKLIWK